MVVRTSHDRCQKLLVGKLTIIILLFWKQNLIRDVFAEISFKFFGDTVAPVILIHSLWAGVVAQLSGPGLNRSWSKILSETKDRSLWFQEEIQTAHKSWELQHSWAVYGIHCIPTTQEYGEKESKYNKTSFWVYKYIWMLSGSLFYIIISRQFITPFWNWIQNSSVKWCRTFTGHWLSPASETPLTFKGCSTQSALSEMKVRKWQTSVDGGMRAARKSLLLYFPSYAHGRIWT